MTFHFKISIVKLQLYSSGYSKILKELTSQHLIVISLWYLEYIKSRIQKNDIVQMSENLSFDIYTEFDYTNDEIYEILVKLGDQDFPFYMNKNGNLELSKYFFKYGSDISFYDEDEQDFIEEELNNTFELMILEENIYKNGIKI